MQLVHLDCVKVRVVCGQFIKGGAGPLGVMEIKPFVDDTFCLEPVPQFVQISGHLLEGSPEHFDKDFVEMADTTIH